MKLRNAAGIVLLAAAAAASYWWSRPPPAEPAARRGNGAELPGYYLRGARIVGTDEQGRVALEILADSLAELPGQDRLSLDGVRIEYTPADAAPWSISASHAVAPKDHSQVDLEGDVTLRSTPADGKAPIEISTSKLRFVRDESEVSTDQSIELRRGRMSVHGVGLRAHLNAGTLALESKVHGNFSR